MWTVFAANCRKFGFERSEPVDAGGYSLLQLEHFSRSRSDVWWKNAQENKRQIKIKNYCTESFFNLKSY